MIISVLYQGWGFLLFNTHYRWNMQIVLITIKTNEIVMPTEFHKFVVKASCVIKNPLFYNTCKINGFFITLKAFTHVWEDCCLRQHTKKTQMFLSVQNPAERWFMLHVLALEQYQISMRSE